MKKALTVLMISFILTACGNEGSGSSAQSNAEEAQSGEETKQASSSSRGPKWEIEIEGLPAKSGRIITAVTMGANGRYSLGRSGFTASISVEENEPHSNMMINFNDDNARCFNKGDATVLTDGDRAVLSGQVHCMPKDGGDASPAAIEGWFELKH